ncbi:hypothetical protein OSTOST_06687, partial [Ostertagia ostertagi]
AVGIGCFVCSSFDGNNRACEDPFNSTLEASSKFLLPKGVFKQATIFDGSLVQGVLTKRTQIYRYKTHSKPSLTNLQQREAASITNYHHPCWAFKKGRQGLFPADHCIKIIGHRAENTTKTMIIRTCALDSGTLTADTEIVRISHCGHFKFEGYHYTGCVQACDSDGCNSSHVRFSTACLSTAVVAWLITNLLRP